jgi:hypothetical protein
MVPLGVGYGQSSYVGGEAWPLRKVFPYGMVVNGQGDFAIFDVSRDDDIFPCGAGESEGK